MPDSLRELFGLDNHYKLVATASWLFGLAADVWFIRHHAPYTFVLAFTSLVFVAPYGLKGLTAWLKTRGGGTVDSLAQVASEIKARREAVGGDHEPTP